MWIYEIASGSFTDPSGAVLATGYSGFGPAQNDPTQADRPGLGPIPPGVYWIGAEYDSGTVGPVALPLLPAVPPLEVRQALPGARGTNTHGRDAFRIHGDSREHPGQASHGCIILPRPVRERVADSPDRLLVVLP